MLAPDFVQQGQHLRGAEFFAINGHHIATGISQLDDLRFGQRFFWAFRPAPHIVFRGEIGVFQHAAFVADVQQIGIHAVGRAAAFAFFEIDGDAVFISISQQLFAAEQIPFAPRCNHFDIGHQGVSAEFKTHLVIALARSAVADGVATGFFGDFYQSFGNQGARDRCAQQVFAFVQGVGAEHREDEIAHKFFAQVFDKDVFFFGIVPS